jgi:hypothetical protein
MDNFLPIKLYFKDAEKWSSLPTWAEYFINIGKQITLNSQSESRIVTAIIVPTRAFGAAFTSLGMIISNASRHYNQTSKADHFEKIFDLPPGTPVIYLSNKKEILKGILQNPEDYHGQLYVRVQVQSDAGGALTFLVGESKAFDVQLAGHSVELLKRRAKIRTQSANKFANILLGENDSFQMGLYSKPICVLIGRKNILEYEICETPLAIHVNGKFYAEGNLQDILSVDQFFTETQPHRSILISTVAKPPSNEILSDTTMGVVFDGALSFLKWGGMFRSRHQIIILDRTETYFDDAINAINTRFSQNNIDDEITLTECEVPPGTEVITFGEVVE